MTMRSKVEQFTANIMCPRCGTFGAIVWENDAGKRSLVSLSANFYERMTTKKPFPIELVCNDCGSVQIEDQFELS